MWVAANASQSATSPRAASMLSPPSGARARFYTDRLAYPPGPNAGPSRRSAARAAVRGAAPAHARLRLRLGGPGRDRDGHDPAAAGPHPRRLRRAAAARPGLRHRDLLAALLPAVPGGD